MKRYLFFILWIGFILAAGNLSGAETTLQVLNPRGEITLPPVVAPAGRLVDFEGKKIGLYWNGKAGGNHFWNSIEKLLRQRLPNASVVRFEGAFDLGDDLAAKMAKETDAFLYGVGD